MTAGEIGSKIWAFISKLWTTKVGKIILIVVFGFSCATFGGSVGFMTGCNKQLQKTKAVKEQLVDAKKELKAKEKEVMALEKQVVEEQKIIKKLDKKGKYSK
jgi:hypothetical protein